MGGFGYIADADRLKAQIESSLFEPPSVVPRVHDYIKSTSVALVDAGASSQG